MSSCRDKKTLVNDGVESELISPQVGSPCVSVCALDSHDICIGCHRSAEEIANWVGMNDNERREVLLNTGVRSRKNNPFA